MISSACDRLWINLDSKLNNSTLDQCALHGLFFWHFILCKKPITNRSHLFKSRLNCFHSWIHYQPIQLRNFRTVRLKNSCRKSSVFSFKLICRKFPHCKSPWNKILFFSLKLPWFFLRNKLAIITLTSFFNLFWIYTGVFFN